MLKKNVLFPDSSSVVKLSKDSLEVALEDKSIDFEIRGKATSENA
jgi:hypothetical protein